MNKKEALDIINKARFEIETSLSLNQNVNKIPNKFWKDKPFIFQAVKKNGLILQFADKSLKKDKSIVLEAVIQNGFSFEYADESLKKNKSFILAVLKEFEFVGLSEIVLQYVDKSLQKDLDIIKAAKR